jgi:hypothetical protein
MQDILFIRHSCLRKKRYTSEHYAEKVIKKMKSEGKDPTNTLNVYWCKFCHHYHIGHKKVI